MGSGELSKLEHQGGLQKFIQGKQSGMYCSLLGWKALWCFKNQGGFLNMVLSKLCHTRYAMSIVNSYCHFCFFYTYMMIGIGKHTKHLY